GQVVPERLLELPQVVDRVSPLPLSALPLLAGDVATPREAGPVGFDELSPERVLDGLWGGVGVGPSMPGAIHIARRLRLGLARPLHRVSSAFRTNRWSNPILPIETSARTARWLDSFGSAAHLPIMMSA